MFQAKTLVMRALAGLLAISTTGCFSIGGSNRYDSKTPTLGKQLMDLKTARDNGAMSDMEYQESKSNLLSNRQ